MVDYERNKRVRRALADLLRARRIAIGISQEELGRRTGIPQSNISMFERAGMFPSIPRLLLLARHLDINIGDLAAAGVETEPNGAAA